MYANSNEDNILKRRHKHVGQQRLLAELSSLLHQNYDTPDILHKIHELQKEYATHTWAMLSEEIPIHVLKMLLSSWDGPQIAEFLLKADQNTISAFVHEIDDNVIIDAMHHMNDDELESMSDRVSAFRFNRLLTNVSTNAANELRICWQHSKDEVGRYMSFDYVAVNTGSTIAETIVQFRMMKDCEDVNSVFVVNAFNDVVGVCLVSKILTYADETVIDDIMGQIDYKVKADDNRDLVIKLIERCQVLCIPVVNDEGQLLGIVSFTGLLEIVHDVSMSTINSLVGVHTDDDVDHMVSYLNIIKRFPWLLMTVCSGILSAVSIAYFGSFLGDRVSVVVFFLPLITGMTGNIGIQASTMMVRRIAISGFRRNIAFFSKEVKTGIVTGLFFGVLMFFLVSVLWSRIFSELTTHLVSPFAIAGCVGGGILISSIWAAGLGALTPLLFEYIGIDPALAAGPLVTALNDVVAMNIYLHITMLMFWFV